MTLDGKVALVIGGGRGLGAAICRALAEAGARVVVSGPQEEAARNVAEEIREYGGRAVPLFLDASRPEEAERALRSLVGDFGRLDVLIHNSTGAAAPDPLIRAALPYLRLTKGHVVFVLSPQSSRSAGEVRARGVRVSAVFAQEPANVARTVLHVLLAPEGTVISEVTVLPVRESA